MLDSLSSSILLQPLVYYSTFVLNLRFCLLSKIASFCQLNRQYLRIVFIDRLKNTPERTFCAFSLSATITTIIPNLISDLASEVHMTWQWKHSGSGFKRCFLPGYKARRINVNCFKVSFVGFPPPSGWVCWFVCFRFQNISSDLNGKIMYIYLNNKRSIQKIYTPTFSLHPVSTLCWVYKSQFQNLCSKISCSRCDRAALEQEFPILIGKKPNPQNLKLISLIFSRRAFFQKCIR